MTLDDVWPEDDKHLKIMLFFFKSVFQYEEELSVHAVLTSWLMNLPNNTLQI